MQQPALPARSQKVGTGTFFLRYFPRYFQQMRRLLTALLLLALTLAGGACSNRALYENIRQNQLRACEELPVPQQATCKAQYSTTYEQYRRERDRSGGN